MRLSERIQNGNTTNFLKSLNEGVKLDEARSHKEENEKVAPRKSSFDKVVDGEASIGVYDDKDERNYADRYKEPIYAKRNKVKNFTDEKKGRASFKDKFNKRVTHIDYEKPLNKDSADYKRLKADSELPFPDVEAGEKAKEILKRRGIKTESANLKEEISEEVIAVAKQISDKIQETGIMNFEEVDNMAAELLGITLDELKNKELDTDVHIALNYQGIDNNFSGGDFFTQEYAKEHPEVLEESSLKESDEELNNSEIMCNFIADLFRNEAEDLYSNFETFNGWCEGGEVFRNADFPEDKCKELDKILVEISPLVDEVSNKLYGYLNESCNKDTKTESVKTLTLRPTSSKLNEADSLELKEEYTISDLDNLVWSGARDRWIDYTDEQKEFLVDYFYEAFGYIDGEIPTTTEFNDFIWFEADDILEENGITGETSEDDEEDTEEV